MPQPARAPAAQQNGIRLSVFVLVGMLSLLAGAIGGGVSLGFAWGGLSAGLKELQKQQIQDAGKLPVLETRVKSLEDLVIERDVLSRLGRLETLAGERDDRRGWGGAPREGGR